MHKQEQVYVGLRLANTFTLDQPVLDHSFPSSSTTCLHFVTMHLLMQQYLTLTPMCLFIVLVHNTVGHHG